MMVLMLIVMTMMHKYMWMFCVLRRSSAALVSVDQLQQAAAVNS
jgi:hypothetical protein